MKPLMTSHMYWTKALTDVVFGRLSFIFLAGFLVCWILDGDIDDVAYDLDETSSKSFLEVMVLSSLLDFRLLVFQ